MALAAKYDFAREISAESAENSRFRAGSYYSLLPRRLYIRDRLKHKGEGKMALLTDALVARAKAVKSAAELLELAKENDFLMSEEEAEEYFAMLQASANQ